MPDAIPRFLPDFLSALLVNFQVALLAMLVGLALGLPLAWARFGHGLATAPATGVAAVMRSIPTFVTMFFVVNVIPASFHVGSWQFVMSPAVAVVVALAMYAAAHVSDNGLEAMRQVRSGSPIAAQLFLISLLRLFFVLVLTSGFGAAIGLVEAVTITMRAVEALPQSTDKLMLMGVVIVIFTVCFQTFYQVTHHLRNKINQSYNPAIRRSGSL
jgi:ABC-type arginine transport system permease subunit